jgi:uncharacterized protein YegL
MPQLNNHTMSDQPLPTGQYGFSATRVDHLGASEYTLVTIVTDVSPSVGSFVREMETALKEIITACKYSPRADNLMLRLVTFDADMREAHGFKMLEQCRLDDYKGCLKIGSATALYDAAENCVTAMNVYGKQLTDANFGVNGIVFVITDGEDNASTLSIRHVREALELATKTEAMQSMVSILIGVNVKDQRIGAYLQDFKNEAGFTHYVEIGNANARALAKLADFVSRYISSQSQLLSSGAVSSQSLTF